MADVAASPATLAAGLPAAQFIEDVEAYVGERDPDAVLKELQNRYSQMKMIEQQLQRDRVRLQQKIPDIERALATVVLLLEKSDEGEDVKVDFELTDSVFAKAVVSDPKSVFLWLGANVMLEYELPEAKDLLTTNLANAKANLETTKSEMLRLRDNVTIIEVSIARVYNFTVSKRRAGGKAEE